MFSQIQIVISVSSPFTLLEHPEFLEGFSGGQETFQEGFYEEYYEKNWTEDEIIQFVEEELSSKQHRRDQRLCQGLGYPYPSYLQRLGFVVGYLDQALATTGQKQEQSLSNGGSNNEPN